MDHVHLYRTELAYLRHGRPVWEPNPGTLYDRVRIGDVGYFQNEKFVPLFNILPPDDSNGSRRLPFPQPNFPALHLPDNYPLTHETNPLEAGVYALESSLNFSVSVELDSAGSVLRGESSLTFTNEKGAALILPSEARREDTLYDKLFEKHMIDNYRKWYEFAVTECHRRIGMSDLILVTGCDLTCQWATATYFRNNQEITATLGAQVPSVAEASFSLSAGWRKNQAMNTRRGPPQDRHRQLRRDDEETQNRTETLVNNQCIFLRGFYVKDRLLWKRQVMKAGAGYHDPGKHGPEEDKVEGLLADEDVTLESLSLSTQGESLITVLLDYMLEGSDADLVIANDADLWPYLLGEEANHENLRATLDRMSPSIKVEDGVGFLVANDINAVESAKEINYRERMKVVAIAEHEGSDVDSEGLDDLGDEFIDDDDVSFIIPYNNHQEEEELAKSEVPPLNDLGVVVCIVCQKRPRYSRGGKSYLTCGLTCASILTKERGPIPSAYSARQPRPRPTGSYTGPSRPSGSYTGPSRPSGSYTGPSRPSGSYTGPSRPPPTSPTRPLERHSAPQRQRNHGGTQPHARPAQATVPTATVNTDLCVVCLVKTCHDSRYLTCGPICTEKLCNTGGANPNLCNYCHRNPKLPGQNQCGDVCKANARLACLMCKIRPKARHYQLCGKTCKEIAIKETPLILEVPNGHVIYEMVENKFMNSWKFPHTRIPIIQKIYKVIENKSFLQSYDKYKKVIGNEVFRFHGTTRKCTLGAPGNTEFCSNTNCPLCSILKTSFKSSLANPSGAFGPGVYSSSASNKAYSYTANGGGAVLLTKVVLGKVRKVTGWNEVMSCPPGFNSVVFERQNDCLNETVVYSDEAIRPIFLIIF